MGPPLDAAGRRPILLGSEGFFVPGALAAQAAQLFEHGAAWARQNEIGLAPELAECITVARLSAQRNAESRLSGTPGVPQVGSSVRVDPEMMTTAQVATRLSCGERNVRSLAERQTLPGRRHHRHGWLFHPDDVAAFVAAREDR